MQARTSTTSSHAATGTLPSAPAQARRQLVLQATLKTQMERNAISSDPGKQAGRTPQRSAGATATTIWPS